MSYLSFRQEIGALRAPISRYFVSAKIETPVRDEQAAFDDIKEITVT